MMDDGSLNQVVKVESNGREFQMVLPEAGSDWIQSLICKSGQPYEHEMLLAMEHSVPLNGTVVDAGANVGNHSIFLAALRGATVWAFEPDSRLAQSLIESARINGVSPKVRVLQSALGDHPGQAYLVNDDVSNLGGQRVTFDPRAGGVVTEVVTLDSTLEHEHIDALKIDVEGSEVAVLQGGLSMIERCRPEIWVECLDAKSYDQVASILRPLGYRVVAIFNASPTLQFHWDPATDAEHTAVDSAMHRMYEEHSAYLSTRKALSEIRNIGTDANSLQRTADREWPLQETLRATRAELHQLKARISRADQDFATLRNFVRQAVDWDLELTQRRDEVATLRSEFAQLTKSFELEREKNVNLESAMQNQVAKANDASSALTQRLKRVEAELETAREQLVNLRHSRTYRTGLAIRRLRTARGVMDFLPRTLNIALEARKKVK